MNYRKTGVRSQRFRLTTKCELSTVSKERVIHRGSLFHFAKFILLQFSDVNSGSKCKFELIVKKTLDFQDQSVCQVSICIFATCHDKTLVFKCSLSLYFPLTSTIFHERKNTRNPLFYVDEIRQKSAHWFIV